ncbi:fms-related tyrosine kinase 3 ligand isoform X2 [Hyla sarda]|uniref:fms-related tyrosine kinase 3 ligand isoform X2 n=1 Tax=Hyla sarda TaxID=327740 RepID=UPI0024C2195E|nr:fms-related tyrosine kinase 3 ligand isoform X2 [Hyla sarda]
MCVEDITASFFTPASKFSYEEMINCHDFRGKGTVFLLVIYLALSYCCNFEYDPISSGYMKKIKMLEDYILADYQVDMPKLISEKNEDQNCLHLLMLFRGKHMLANLRPGPKLKEIIKDILNELNFLEDCPFMIPPSCPNERVNLSNVLQNISGSLASLQPNILNNFSHCLHIKCATVSSSDHGDHAKQSSGERNHYVVTILSLTVIAIAVVL